MYEEENKLPDSLNEFLNNIDPSLLGHNFYHIQCHNMDGELTEEKFGLNVLTDTGMNNCIKTTSNPTFYVVFGIGIGTPSYTDTKLFTILPNSIMFRLNRSDTGYSNIYDSTNNRLIGRKYVGYVEMDYNYSWLTSNVDITEFGQTTDRYNLSDYLLYTHCLIYDAQGNPSHFTKRLNEKVTIYFYKSTSIDCSIISNMNNQGKYMFISPSYLTPTLYSGGWQMPSDVVFLNGRSITPDDFPIFNLSKDMKSEQSSYYRYMLYYYNAGFGPYGIACGTNGEYSYLPVKVDDDNYRSNRYTQEFTITNKKSNKCGLFVASNTLSNYYYHEYGYFRAHLTFMYIEKVNLPEYETLTSVKVFTDSFKSSRFRNCFGLHDLLYGSDDSYQYAYNDAFPVNDASIQSVSRYNSLTGDYTTIEEFVDDPTYDFRNVDWAMSGGFYINDTRYNVMININTDVPITGFLDAQGIDKFYATDTYWDTSTYELIPENNNVPTALQKKRYYIRSPYRTTDYDTRWVPGMHAIRKSNGHKLVTSFEPYELQLPMSIPNKCSFGYDYIYASDTGWIFYNDFIIFPESLNENGQCYMHDLRISTGESYSDIFYGCRCTENRAVVLSQVNSLSYYQELFRIYKIDVSKPGEKPTYKSYKPSDVGFNSSVYGAHKYFTFYVHKEKNILFIIRDKVVRYIDMNSEDMNAVTLTTHTTQPYFTLIYDTNFAVYKHPDYLNKFVILNLNTFTVETEFELTDVINLQEIHGIFGYYDKIFIQGKANDHYYLYRYDMITGSISAYLDYRLSPAIFPDHEYRNRFIASLVYDDKAMFATTGNNYTTGCQGLLLFKENTDIWYNLSHPNVNSSTDKWLRYAGSSPMLKTFNDGKDWILGFLGYYRVSETSTQYVYGTECINLSYIKNNNITTLSQCIKELSSPWANMPLYQVSGPSSTLYHRMIFYKNSVIVFEGGVKNPTVCPIELFLPHKMTIKTKTIQAYNNPRNISSKYFGIIATNH